jgi:Carboxypeptidase regulatory-like domain
LVGQISYQLTDAPASQYGHRLLAGYQIGQQTTTTNIATNNNSLTTIGWQYRSPELTSDGSSIWQTELGYSWSSFGSGFSAGADLALFAGWRLRGNYRGVSDTSNQADFSLGLVTTLLFDGNVRGTNDRITDLRTFGRLQATAFFDDNLNGIQDSGEKSYWDPLLLRINENELSYYRNQVEGSTGVVSLQPGSYRVDVDPAGYPPNYRSVTPPQRVDIVASGISRVSIPLTPAYIVTGTLKDQNNNPIADARVEIIGADGRSKADSITNGAGLFYLEDLGQGEYKFKVSNYPIAPATIKIDATSKPLQEITLTVQLPQQTPEPKEKSAESSSLNRLMLFEDRHIRSYR